MGEITETFLKNRAKEVMDSVLVPDTFTLAYSAESERITISVDIDMFIDKMSGNLLVDDKGLRAELQRIYIERYNRKVGTLLKKKGRRWISTEKVHTKTTLVGRLQKKVQWFEQTMKEHTLDLLEKLTTNEQYHHKCMEEIIQIVPEAIFVLPPINEVNKERENPIFKVGMEIEGTTDQYIHLVERIDYRRYRILQTIYPKGCTKLLSSSKTN